MCPLLVSQTMSFPPIWIEEVNSPWFVLIFVLLAYLISYVYTYCVTVSRGSADGRALLARVRPLRAAGADSKLGANDFPRVQARHQAHVGRPGQRSGRSVDCALAERARGALLGRTAAGYGGRTVRVRG